jgi:hypothetical protein
MKENNEEIVELMGGKGQELYESKSTCCHKHTKGFCWMEFADVDTLP